MELSIAGLETMNVIPTHREDKSAAINAAKAQKTLETSAQLAVVTGDSPGREANCNRFVECLASPVVKNFLCLSTLLN